MNKENLIIRICEHMEGKLIESASNAKNPYSGGISPKSGKEIAILLCKECHDKVENKKGPIEDIMLYGNED